MKGGGWGDGRLVEIDFCASDAAEGIIGAGVNLFCGVAVDDSSAECDHDAAVSTESCACGEAQIGLCIRALHPEGALCPRKNDGAGDVFEHIIESGGGVCHRIRAVGDDDAVVCLTAACDALGDALPVRRGDIG